MTKVKLTASKHIYSLNMNGLRGRMLHLPAPENGGREILIVYGVHSSLERWMGFAELFNRYGSVTMPDLPGFGGMDSFYKLGQKPTIDNLADYLAAFIKLRYKRRRLTLVGMSFGFVVITRLLQRFPELAKRVDMVISLAGFTSHQDFLAKDTKKRTLRPLAYFFSLPVANGLFRLALHPAVLRRVYLKRDHPKFKGLSAGKKERMLKEEIKLWNSNDARTHMYTVASVLALDNTKKRVALPIYHVGANHDHFFDSLTVEQHLRAIFTDYTGMLVKIKQHAPVIAEVKDVAPLVPPKLRRLLETKS